MKHAQALRTILGLLAPMALLAGCLTPATLQQQQQFLLNPQFEVPAASAVANVAVGVRPVVAARPYALSMLRTDADGALVPYTGATWAEPPADSLTRALRDALAHSGRFADVGDAAEMARPDYILTGALRRFDEDRASGAPQALIEARFELREARGPKHIWAETLTARAPITEEKPAAHAAAMEAALADLVTRAATAVTSVPLP
jgi:ABC-type uncharacterized transport system auxiliary subunit